MLRLKKSLVILTLVIVFTVVFFGCDRRGTLNGNKLPEVKITTYAGQDEVNTELENPIVFQQTIRWKSSDADGVVIGYAYRVVNEGDGGDEYLSTPGNEFKQDLDGWIYHYQDGADESLPMDSEDAKITIWSKDVYAVINFPAANADGDSANIVSRFDLKCMDNSGGESEIVKKYVNAFSEKSGISVSSTNGNIDGKVIGTGITLMFSILDHNEHVTMTPDYFEFQLATGKRDSSGVYSDVDVTHDWISTASESNISNDINKYVLTNTGSTFPNLPPNEVTGTDTTFTLIIARAFDIAGLVSDIDTIGVFVSDMFYPSTIIFDGYDVDGEVDAAKRNNVWVIGENHYSNSLSSKLNITIPSVYTPMGIRYSVPFWLDMDGKFTAVNSSDLNIHINWTWKGNLADDEVDGKQEGYVKDDATGLSYITDVVAFDIRLDGEAFVYPPLPGSSFNVMDDNGDEWLRVYDGLGLDLFQKALLYGLESGEHTFEVRSFDLQGRVDPTPAILEFTLYDAVPQDEKNGILIVDNDYHDANYAPDADLDSLYNYYVSSFSGNVEVIDYETYNADNSLLHFDKSKLALTDLQNYKLVIWHRDRPTAPINFLKKEEVLLDLYLNTGGNLVFSSTNTLTEEYNTSSVNPDKTLFWNRLGLPIALTGNTGMVNNLGVNSMLPGNSEGMTRAIMRKAIPAGGFTQEVNLVSPEDMFNLHQSICYSNFDVYGFGLLSYFNENNLLPSADVIYRLGCKPANEGTNYDITEGEFEFYNNQPIGIKNVIEGSNCYTFGSPLSYFDKDDVKAMIEQILTEVGL